MIFFTRDRFQRSAIETEATELRQFFVEHFSRDEMEVFCADYFRDVYVDFEGSDMSKTQWAHKLVDYCRRRSLMPRLRAAIQKERREPFTQRFALIPEAGAPRFSRDKGRIFISHAHEDRQVAQRLASDLRKHGHNVWIAPDSIELGESWVSAIDRGLHNSGVFLALLSPAAVKSPWVKSETRVAIQLEHQKKMRVLPVMLKPCDTSDLSTFIASYQIISFTNRYEKALPELLVELGSSRARVAAQAIARRLQGNNGKTRWAKQVRIDVPICMELLRVPAGSFWMGSHPERDADAQENEQPRHRVKLTDFYIARTPITNLQYAMFAQATQRDFKLPEGKEEHPAVNVSWHDAVAFCAWLSQLTGFQFSLPTEAEWEKAARGTDGRIYPWGDEFDAKRLNSYESGIRGTTPAGKYSPEHDSPYGIADLCGNVWEWCADWYADDEYARRSRTKVTDPMGPEAGTMKVLRGGAFDFNKGAMRCAYRAANSPFERSYDYGFRVVMRP
jgi:formylglycine-generating enzyme required for sulfatase activity